MKALSTAIAFAAFATSLSAALPSQAGMVGYFDYASIGMTDDLYGWVCENEDPTHTSSYGSLDVYYNTGSGLTYYGNFGVSTLINRADVNSAGYCGTDPYVGFDLAGWFFQSGPAYTDIYVFWHATNGTLTLLGGSPKHTTGPGTYY